MKKLSLILAVLLAVTCLYTPVTLAADIDEYITETTGFKSAKAKFSTITKKDSGNLSPEEIADLLGCISDGMQEYKGTIDISEYNIAYTEENREAIGNLIDYCIKTVPEIFHIKSASIGFYETSGKYKSITFSEDDYYYSETDYKKAIGTINDEVEKFIEKYNLNGKKSDGSELTQLEKALLVHDILIQNTEYDYENYCKEKKGEGSIPRESFNPIGTLVNHICVCEGYSRTYLWILRELGVNCYLCSSATCGHMWNVVKIDGKYYYVDLTDDDPPDVLGRVYHDYFLVSEGKLREVVEDSETGEIFENHHRPDGKDNTDKDIYENAFDYICDCDGIIEKTSKDGEDAKWLNSNTGFQFVAGDIYYIDNYYTDSSVSEDGKMSAHIYSLTNEEFNTAGEDNKGYYITGTWYDDDDTIYADNFSRLASDENHLFFNTSDKLWSLNLTDGLGTVVPLRDEGSIELPENHEIYGFNINDEGKFAYQTATNADIFPDDERNIITEDEAYSEVMFMYFDKNDILIKNKKDYAEYYSIYADPFKTGAYDPSSKGIGFEDSITVEATDNSIIEADVGWDTDYMPCIKITPKKIGNTAIKIKYSNDNLEDIEITTSIEVEIPVIVDDFNLGRDSKNIKTPKIEDQPYIGKAHEPNDPYPWIEYHGHLLEKDKHYTISFENNINVGTAYVVFNGIGDYSGKAKISFKILPVTLVMDLKKLMSDAEYTGKPAKVKFTTVSFGKSKLKEGTDYTIAYKNNINVGTAHITLTGKGNFTGSVSASFEILPTVPKTATLSQKTYTYDGKVKKPSVIAYNKWGKKIPSSQYTVKYASGRKAVGRYKVTVTFKNNYAGKAVMYFEIKPPKPKITSIKAKKKKLNIYWGKKKGITGYQIQLSTSKKFKSAKTALIKKSKTSVSVSGLKGKKKYYVRLRTYKKVGKEYFYSSWSNCIYKKTK